MNFLLKLKRFIIRVENHFHGKGMVYLASPYSDESGFVQSVRHKEAEFQIAQMMNDGLLAFSPIVHCHHLAMMHHLPATFDFWQNYCLGMLNNASELWVLMLPGWENSTGVQAEIKYAQSLNMPIYYLHSKRDDSL